MATTYPLTFPTHTGIRSITLRQANVVALSHSPFTFKQQAISHAGQRWEADIALLPMGNADAKAWIAWLSSLKGQRGTFVMGDPTGATPLGSAGGSPLVNGANQTGSELVLDGATVSQTGWLKAGDYVQLGAGSSSTLHMVLADADSDVSGNVALDIWPDMRTPPVDNAAVVVSSAKGLWRLNTNLISWDVNVMSRYGITFNCVEAIV